MKENTISGQSTDIVEKNINKLKELFPEIVTENKIDFGKLQEVFGVYIEKDNELVDYISKKNVGKHIICFMGSYGWRRMIKEVIEKIQ